ncbi:MAG: tol-pal system YbgF family protein [Nitrospinales bacterium]
MPSLFGHPGDPRDRHSWSPPSEKVLQFRRNRQKALDAVAKRIETLFLTNEDIAREEEALLASLRTFDPRLGNMEAQIKQKIKTVEQNFGQVEAQLAKAKITGKNLETAIAEFKNYKPPKKFSVHQYSAAIELFKGGKYQKCIDQFQKILQRRPPRFLADNIHFGIGSAYYKLNQLDKAARHYQIITQKYPTGDKWPASYIMLGLIYDSRNEKSRAIYFIESALEKKLQEQPRHLLEHLLTVIQEEEPDVSS